MSRILAVGGVYNFKIEIEGTMQFAAERGATEDAMKTAVQEAIYNGVSLSAKLGPSTRSMKVEVTKGPVRVLP